MFLARVIGRVVATRKVTGLAGVALLVIERMDGTRPTGVTLVAADRAQSGEGDLVMVEDGREAALALPVTFVPVEATRTLPFVSRVAASLPVSPAAPVSCASAAAQSLRTRTTNVPCAGPAPGGDDSRRTAPFVQVAPASRASHAPAVVASVSNAYSRPASAR